MSAVDRPNVAKCDRGFTLLELMLVLALLAAVLGLASPLLRGSLDRQRLRSAADELSSAWGRTRLRAIRDGQIWYCTYQPDSGQYGIAPLRSNPTNNTPAITSDTSNSGNSGPVPANANVHELPSGIVFSNPSSAASVAPSNTSPAMGQAMCFFYPDGTTSTVQLELRNDRQDSIEVTLRGLTGTVTVGQVVATRDGGP